MPGVKAIVQYSRGVAVVADSYWNAKKAKDLLVVNYDTGPNAGLNMTTLGKVLKDLQLSLVLYLEKLVMLMLVCLRPLKQLRLQVPFQSHFPMEPQNTVDVRGDKAIIITPTQFQQLVLTLLQELLALSLSK